MFQIKQLNSACSVLYYISIEKKHNCLLYVNLFFINRTNASVLDSRKTIKY